jgi:adenylate kinase
LSIRPEIYIFMGPPGAGKGSLSSLCCQKLGWEQLSTGNLCREHIAQNSDIGKQIDFLIKSGKLISDSLILTLVRDWLFDRVQQKKTIILDGFPRTLSQATALDTFLKREVSQVSLRIVKMELADEIVIQRLASRVICENNRCQAVYSASTNWASGLACNFCRHPLIRRTDDSDVRVIQERLMVYHNNISGLLSYYEQSGRKIETLNVESSLEDVFCRFSKIVGAVL